MEIKQKLKPVTFHSAGSHRLQLEGVLHTCEGPGRWSAAVVCHPHPLGGGTMHNGLVLAIARALAARGVLALRFNFRGVGASEGHHDGGRGEQFDVAGAVDWLLAQPGAETRRVSLVGYSFGAGVALAYATTDPRIAAVAAVSLAADARNVDVLRSLTCPKLFVAGQDDQLTSPHLLRELVEDLPEPKELRLVAGSDHFWYGQEIQVAEMVTAFVAAL